jgi:hypothetical protein
VGERGRDRVRERLVEGVEERRRKVREEKEGEGTVGGMFSPHSLIHSFTAGQTPPLILNLVLTSHVSCGTNWGHRRLPRLLGCQSCRWQTGWVV